MPRKDGFEPGAPSWVDLATTDVEAAKTFYSGLFGWRWQAEPASERGVTYWMATLEGWPVAGLTAQSVPSVWNTYVNVANVDEAFRRAITAGAAEIIPPGDAGDSGRMAMVLDPAGAPIGMWQPGAHKGAGLVGEPGTMIWHEVYASDTEAEVAFYGAVFGWTPNAIPAPEGPAYTSFMLGDARIAGTYPPMNTATLPHWQVWFGAADTAATAQRVRDLGGEVLVGPSDSPVGSIAFLRDPVGGLFSIHTAGSA